MPNPSGSRDIRAALSGQVEGSIPSGTGPFGLDLCGFMVWIITGAVGVGMLVAFGFALATGGGDRERRPPENIDFGTLESPGLSGAELEALGDIFRRD